MAVEQKKWKTLPRRVATAVVLIPIIVVPVLLGGWWLVGLLLVASGFAVREWVRLTNNAPRSGEHLVMFSAVALSLLAVVWGGIDILVFTLVAGGVFVWLMGGRFGAPIGGYLYITLPICALYWVRVASPDAGFLLWVLLSVWAVDIFAYFAGRAIGGPKLIPRLSPNKTWAGLAGGIFGAGAIAVMAVLLAPYFALEVPMVSKALMLAVAIAFVAQAGDFFESWLKRRYRVKDTSDLLPGHGGVLDRADGLIGVLVVMLVLSLLAGETPYRLVWGL